MRILPFPATVAETVRRTRDDGHGNADLTPIVADSPRGYPCRVCLRDAAAGEEVLLFSHRQSEAVGPYQEVGPVFIHASPCPPHTGGVTEAVRTRLLSVRAYDAGERMLDADVTEGNDLEALAARLFADPRAATIQVHFARTGCYACTLARI